MSDAAKNDPCDACGESTTNALARTVRLSVDRANIDTQRLCPECFADWIHRYQEKMGREAASIQRDAADSDIIID